MGVKLYTALKASYGDKSAISKMQKKGFVQDTALSNDNQQIYYKQKNGKLLNTVAGTHNWRDWGTDAYFAAGHLKDTARYKEAKATLEKAKAKYHPKKTVIAGHSLGNSIGQYIGGRKDKVVGLDGGYTIGQHTRTNVHNFRSSGDAVSLLGVNSKHMKTIPQKGGFLQDHKYAIAGALTMNPFALGVGLVADAVRNHDVKNIKHEKIFV